MKKSIGIGILFLSMISCGYLFQLENDEKLAEKIETELNSENGKIDFSKITDFDWNSLIILANTIIYVCNIAIIGHVPQRIMFYQKYKIDFVNHSHFS